MTAKKNAARYTIKFDPDIPSHQEAMQTLDEQGRGKAALIAEAIRIRNALYSLNADALAELLNKPEHESNPARLHPRQDFEASQGKFDALDMESSHPTIKTNDTSVANQSDDEFWRDVDNALNTFSM